MGECTDVLRNVPRLNVQINWLKLCRHEVL